MNTIVKVSAVALAIIAHAQCLSMMTVYDKDATFEQHESMLPELKGKVYDKLDLITQNSYLCTNQKSNKEGMDRWKHNFFLAYTTQDPRIARENASIRPLMFLTRDASTCGAIGVIDPTHQSFYSAQAWQEYQNDNAPTHAINHRLPAGFTMNIALFADDQYIGYDKVSHQIVLHAAMGNTEKLQTSIDSTSDYPFVALNQAKHVAIHQKQLPALTLMLDAQRDKVQNATGELKTKYLRDGVCAFKEDIYRSLENQNFDVFRTLVEGVPYEIMTQGIPLCASSDATDTLRDVITLAEKQKLCTQKEVYFFDSVKRKKLEDFRGKSYEDQHCTIL